MSNKSTAKRAEGLSKLELERIVSLSEAARLSGLSEDTWEREHRDRIIRLSQRRRGVRVKHALFLGD